MCDESLMFVSRIGGRHGVDDQPVERWPASPVEHLLVDVWELCCAEVAVSVDIEVCIGEAPVFRELLPVIEIATLGDVEVRAGVKIDTRLPPGRQAEDGPFHEGPHRPGEVV